MITRLSLAAIATLLLVGTAAAAPLLRADIVVSAPVVTVGDMFTDAGIAAETALFRAPKPGTSGLVALADITAAATRAGLAGFDPNGLDTIRVSRAATVVDESVLAGLINADLTQRGILTAGMSADTLFSTPITAINAEAVPEPASIISLRYLPGNGAFSARFAVAGLDEVVDVSGTIELMIDTPHLRQSLPAGSILSPEDVELRAVPLRYAESTGIARLDQVVGMALAHQSREGMMLRPADVGTPLAVGKNDLVTIYFRKGPLTLTVKGQAITAAATGGPIQVLNLMSKRVISATVLAAGAVEVSNDPLALAGL